MKIKLSNFLNGIISLVISQVLIKVFGMIYSLYITNKTGFGDEGNAIYMSGYQIYALLLTVSSIGVPNAISKIISEKKSIKDYLNIERVFKCAIFLFGVIGFCGCVFLFVFSEYIANNILQIPKAKLSLMVLSPAIFFVSISSVIRGFCNGENQIKITAKSQFIEQILKTIFTISFVEIIGKVSNNNTEIMAAMANFATTIATFGSLIYILFCYIKIKNKILNLNDANFPKERLYKIIKNVLKIAVPITMGAILSSLGKNIDSVTIVRILKKLIGENEAIKRYGILSSKIDIITALPLSFNLAISTALIPEISKYKAINDIKGIESKIKFSMLLTTIIGIPASFGIFCYSEQILNLLYPNANQGYELLKISAIGITFNLLTQTINGILVGLGENKIPLITSVIAIFVKLLSNIILIPIKNIYEKGAVIGNVLSAIISFIIVYKSLKKKILIKKGIIKISIKSIFCSYIMNIISLYIFNLMINKKINYNISTLISIIIAVIIYSIGVFVTKMINKSDVYQTIDKTGV